MLAGGLGSQLVEFVGVESHRRELPQCRGVELDVGRYRARIQRFAGDVIEKSR